MSLDLTAAEARQMMTEAQRMIAAIEPSTLANLRNRAIIGVMGYALASLDAVLGICVRDYYVVDGQHRLRLIEEGAQRYELVDRKLEPLIAAYLAAAGIANEPNTLLFRSIVSRQRVSARPVSRQGLVKLIRRFGLSIDDHHTEYQQDEGLTSSPQRELRNLLQSISGSNFTALRDRAILGILAYTGASVLKVIVMKVGDFYKLRGEYWVRVPGQFPVKAAPELAVLMCEYRAAVRVRSREMPFLFGRDRLHPLTPSDMRKILDARGAAVATRTIPPVSCAPASDR